MRNTLLLSAAALSMALTCPANAQDNVPEEDEIIVTGTSTARSKFNTSYAVTSLNSDAIEDLSPLSFVDLLGNIPGIQVESTGGEVQNVYRVRGIPDEGNFQQFQQDGLTLYQSGSGPFFSADVLNRTDLMTERLELVRGGPASVFASNAAAVINQITRKGTDVNQGAVKVTVGDTGLYRLDGYTSGPITENTTFAVGGFIRSHDGYRPAGFTNDKGGQIRGNITHEFDNGDTLTVTGLHLDDNNAFYLSIPIADPRDPSRSLNEFIDVHEGTLATENLQNTLFRYSDSGGGVTTDLRDLSDGRSIKYNNFGLHYDGTVANWNVDAKFGHGEGTMNFDAIYSTTPPQDANDFAAGRLADATAAFGDVNLGYAIAGTNGAEAYDPQASAAGLVLPVQYRVANSEFHSTTADLQFNRTFEAGAGSHDITVGFIGTNYGASLLGRYQNYLFELRSQARALDLVAFDNTTGAVNGSVTDNGVLNYGSALFGGDSDWTMFGAFINDSWQVNDNLRFDAGIRFEDYSIKGFGLNTRSGVDLGDATTLADDSTRELTGTITQRGGNVNVTPWTLGVNYDFNDTIGVYARASKSNRLPFEVVGTIFGTSNLKGTAAQQYEVGLKYKTPSLSAYLTGFQSVFDPFNQSIEVTNPQTGGIERVNFDGKAKTLGVEADVQWTPNDFFALNGTVTYGDPQYTNLTSDTGASPGDVEGNRIRRQAAIFGNIRPTLNFDLGEDSSIEAFARYYFIGERFVDIQNNTALPAYQTLGAGVTYNNGDWRLSVVGDNITNEVGFTEGNPRSDVVSGQGTAEAIYARPIFGRNLRVSVTKSW